MRVAPVCCHTPVTSAGDASTLGSVLRSPAIAEACSHAQGHGLCVCGGGGGAGGVWWEGVIVGTTLVVPMATLVLAVNARYADT
jgi:hypothetical protein